MRGNQRAADGRNLAQCSQARIWCASQCKLTNTHTKCNANLAQIYSTQRNNKSLLRTTVSWTQAALVTQHRGKCALAGTCRAARAHAKGRRAERTKLATRERKTCNFAHKLAALQLCAQLNIVESSRVYSQKQGEGAARIGAGESAPNQQQNGQPVLRNSRGKRVHAASAAPPPSCLARSASGASRATRATRRCENCCRTCKLGLIASIFSLLFSGTLAVLVARVASKRFDENVRRLSQCCHATTFRFLRTFTSNVFFERFLRIFLKQRQDCCVRSANVRCLAECHLTAERRPNCSSSEL